MRIPRTLDSVIYLQRCKRLCFRAGDRVTQKDTSGTGGRDRQTLEGEGAETDRHSRDGGRDRQTLSSTDDKSKVIVKFLFTGGRDEW